MTDLYMGQIIFAGFNYAPPYYASCLGQTISIAQNTALFSLLGVTYGGDGQTTFMLPHAGGRALLGQGQAPGVGRPYAMGEVAGSEATTLTSTQMPAHIHAAAGPVQVQALTGVLLGEESDTPSDGARLGGIGDAGGSGSPVIYVPASVTSGTAVNLGGASFNGTTNVAGGNQPFSLMQPYLVVNALIVVQGIFPSRQ